MYNINGDICGRQYLPDKTDRKAEAHMPKDEYKIPLTKIIEEFDLEKIYEPANIEEMSMIMESAISTARMREIGVGDLSLITSEQDDFLKVSLPDTREGLEALIREHKGCIAKVARACGFSRSMIYKQMNIHGIPVGYK